MAKEEIVHAAEYQYDIPKEILTPIKFLIPVINKPTSLVTIVYALVVMWFTTSFATIVHHKMQIPFMIFMAVMATFWILPSPVTKKKRNVEQLIMVWFHAKDTYHPIRFYRHIN